MSTALYFRSSYSLLESTIKIDEIIQKAKKYGFISIAMVDHNLNGSMTFYKKCIYNNIKPIIGLELKIKQNDKLFEIILYAINNNGFNNLMKLSTLLSERKYIEYEELLTYKNDNIIVISSDNNCFINYSSDILQSLKENFGEYYLGISNPFYKDQKIINDKLRVLAKECNVKCVALNKTYYLDKNDYEVYKVLRAILEKKYIDDKDLIDEKGHYFLNSEEMNLIFSEEELLVSDYIATKCNIDIIHKKTDLPSFETPYNTNAKDYLINLARHGLKLRLKDRINDNYIKRLNYELKIIVSMNFENYFLIVYDFVKFAKRNGIYVGPGRGSAAGSLVSYCLGITEIDPVAYGLIFERFLNPERISMPDIDIDFPDDKRDEVINYVINKYGYEHVAHIVAYGSLSAKQVLRDVARVIKYYDVDTLCKALGNNNKITLKEAYQNIRYFKQRVDYDEKSRKLFDLSLKLEGLPRHITTHAAGIVTSKEKLMDIIPLIKVNDMYLTGYTMEHLEEIGLIKMDFLGIKNLSIIAEVSNDINTSKDFKINNIPIDDSKTLNLIANAKTSGIFQLESTGIQNLLKKFKPNTFEDIALVIALYRPGPMDNIPLFLNNRRYPNKIKYLHPILENILKDTSGIIVYQEQIMQIARLMANFSYSKADIMRKAMSKKKYDELAKLENDFNDGCLKNKIDKNIASEVYALILKFANYGFNKSHSIAYSRVAYEMAYLKANYPNYFYKSLLNGVMGDTKKTFEYINECQRIDIKVLLPSINHSKANYFLDDKGLRMPFGIIKNIGLASTNSILEERRIRGPFTNYEEAIARLKKYLSINVFESLIDAGAFDEFGFNRPTYHFYLKTLIDKDSMINILDNPLLGLRIISQPNDKRITAEKEKRVLGFNFSINQIQETKKLYGIETKIYSELLNEETFIKGFGYVISFREHTNKNKEKMCFIKTGDDTAVIDLVIHSSLYTNKKEELYSSKGKYIYFEGNMQNTGSCVVKRIEVKNNG